MRSTAARRAPQTFPGRYQVAVYGFLGTPSAHVIDQDRDDVQLVRASVDGPASLDIARCRATSAATLDCTDELQRVSGAPSLEKLTASPGYAFKGCQLLRVTTAAKKTALPGAVGIGFYAADVTTAQISADLGRLVSRDQLKPVGNASLKSGEPAVLHEFAGVVNCELAPETIATKQLKPYMDFSGGPPPTMYRNWDAMAGNYALSGQAPQVDRSSEVLR